MDSLHEPLQIQLSLSGSTKQPSNAEETHTVNKAGDIALEPRLTDTCKNIDVITWRYMCYRGKYIWEI